MDTTTDQPPAVGNHVFLWTLDFHTRLIAEQLVSKPLGKRATQREARSKWHH